MTPDSEKAARELLAFYLEAGVDAPVGEAPVDRFARPFGANRPRGSRRRAAARLLTMRRE